MLFEKIQETISIIEPQLTVKPEVAIILGTGLGGLSNQMEGKVSIPYESLPHFPQSTVDGHRGELVIGKLAGKPVVIMEGRFHMYEGYSAQDVAYPVRVMRALGAKTLIASNAAGGLNLQYQTGELMVIIDQINLTGANPLIGPNDERLGPRFPDMSRPYDVELLKLAVQVAGEQKTQLHEGVYVGVMGPNLETAAEYRFLKQAGADAVGMSTIPEVLAAVHGGMRVLAISGITDRCDPDNLKPVSLEEILKIAREIEPKLTQLVTKIVEKL